MLDYQKTLEFLLTNNLSFEELGIILAVYNKTTKTNTNTLSSQYYEENSTYNDLKTKRVIPIKWKDLVENLIEKNFLEDYRTSMDKLKETVPLNKLKVTDEFLNLYFVKKETAYQYVLKLYPDFLYINNKEKVLTKNVDHDRTKEFFYKEVLKGGDKSLFDRFVYLTKEWFDYQPLYENGVEIGGSPTAFAKMKWDNYLKGFETLANDFETGGGSNLNNMI